MSTLDTSLSEERESYTYRITKPSTTQEGDTLTARLSKPLFSPRPKESPFFKLILDPPYDDKLV